MTDLTTDWCFMPGTGLRGWKRSPYEGRRTLLRAQYNALGKRNPAAIDRIVTCKYQRGAFFNRQHPFVDVLFSDITESGEVLDVSELLRKPLPPLFSMDVMEPVMDLHGYACGMIPSEHLSRSGAAEAY